MSDTKLGRAIDEVLRLASVVLLVAVIVVGSTVSSLQGSVDRIEQSVDRTEASASELVDFVHEIQAQQPCVPTTTVETTTTACQPVNEGQTQRAVQLIIDVLCASSDPVRIQACAALTQPPGG